MSLWVLWLIYALRKEAFASHSHLIELVSEIPSGGVDLKPSCSLNVVSMELSHPTKAFLLPLYKLHQ